jgi:hypothetical protein
MIHNHLCYASNILKKLIIMAIYPVWGNRWVAKPPEKTGYPTSNDRLFVAARSGLGEFPKRMGIEYDDSAMLEPNPFARGPNPQLLVDALPGHADHLANFLLGNGDRPPFGMELAPCGQGEQRAGESARQIQQDDLFDLLAGPSQPRTEQLDEFHRQRRLASHKRQEVAAVNDEDFAIGICGGVGRPPLSRKHRNLAECIACTDQIEDRAAAFRRGDADLHRAGYYAKNAVARIALAKDRRSPLQRSVLGITAELVECLRLKIGVDRMLAQDRYLAARSCLVLRHDA